MKTGKEEMIIVKGVDWPRSLRGSSYHQVRALCWELPRYLMKKLVYEIPLEITRNMVRNFFDMLKYITVYLCTIKPTRIIVEGIISAQSRCSLKFSKHGH